jgi:hypothetical protein
MSWFTKFEQVTANTLKSIFMETNALIAESEREIARWEAQVETEKKFLAKISARAHEQAIAAAIKAQEEADSLKLEIVKAKEVADKYAIQSMENPGVETYQERKSNF